MIIHNLTQLTKQNNEYHLLARGMITLLGFFSHIKGDDILSSSTRN